MKRKLSDAQVLAILSDTRTQAEIALEYGIKRETVSQIKNRKIYRHVFTPTESIPETGYYIADALDFMRGLPDSSCPTVITSPPYNLGKTWSGPGYGVSKWKRQDGSKPPPQGYDRHDDDIPHAEYIAWQRACLAEMLRVAGPAGVVFYNHKYRNRDLIQWDHADLLEGFPRRDTIIWHKPTERVNLGGAVMRQGIQNFEMIYVFAGRHWHVADEAKKDFRTWGNVWSIPTPRIKNATEKHPAPFPLALAEQLIRLGGQGRVLDPFAGSGTTGLAAAKLNLPYLLCDLSTKYESIFNERMNG